MCDPLESFIDLIGTCLPGLPQQTHLFECIGSTFIQVPAMPAGWKDQINFHRCSSTHDKCELASVGERALLGQKSAHAIRMGSCRRIFQTSTCREQCVVASSVVPIATLFSQVL